MTKNVILFAVLAFFAAASSFTSGQELALKKLFIDSNVSANETDLEHVQANIVPSIMSDPKSHHSLFARLYQERCLELEPECGVKLYEVCPVKMTTEFEVPFDASLQDASCFFLFPPGALRTALKNAFSKQVKDAFSKEVTDALSKQVKVANYEPPSYSLIKTVFQQVPEYHAPFAPLLAEFSEYYSSDFLTGFKSSIFSLLVFSDRANYGDYMSSKRQVFVLMLFPTIPKSVLKYELLRLLLARLDCAQPGEEALVMGCVNDVVWEMLDKNSFPKRECTSLYYQDKEGVFHPAGGKDEYFLSKVQLIVRNNPTVLLSNLESLQLSNIKPIAPNIFQPFLDGLEYKLLCGDVHVKQCLSKVDIDFILNLTSFGKSDWRYRHYKRVFSLSNSSQEDNSYNVPFDSAANAVSNQGAIIHPAFSVDLQVLLPPLPVSLNTSFRQVTHSSSILNPIKFLTCLTKFIPEDIYDSIVIHFMAGRGPWFSGKERKLVKWMLTVKMVGLTKLKTPLDFFKSQPETNMTFKQKYLIHSVVFRQGAFKWSTTNHDFNDYILACESVARLFYPFYVQKLKTVVQHVDENGNAVRNFEELFMCPFVDKGWLLEYYGNIHVNDINDPTNIHRLYQKGNQELQIQTLIQFIKDFRLFTRNLTTLIWDQRSNLRIRVVELLVSMLQQGYQEQVILVSECFGSFKNDILKNLGLDPSRLTNNTVSLMTNKREYVLKKCNEIVNITAEIPVQSEFDDFMIFLSHVPSFETEEIVFENVQILIFYDEFEQWLHRNQHVGEKVVQRLWRKCLTKDPKAANDWARYATAIFIQVSMKYMIRLIDHVMSLISCEQDLQNFFQFDYSRKTKDFSNIYLLFYEQTVSLVFKRFILRCCMKLPDIMRDIIVTDCLYCFAALLGITEIELIIASLIINFGDLVPEELIIDAVDLLTLQRGYIRSSFN